VKNKAVIKHISLLGLFFILVAFKWFRFEMLAYTIDDFCNNLEGTYSWLLGRPVTWGNGFGQMILAHNYYLMPALAPITYFFGAKGILFFYCSLLLVSWYSYFKVFDFFNRNHLFLFFLLFFSATSFWLLDHPSVGWSMELFYLPFSVLLSSSLIQKNNKQAIFYFIVLCLVREEGMLLAFAIYITHYILENRLFLIYDILRNKKIIFTTVAFLAVFIANFLLLQHRGSTDSFLVKTSNNITEYIFTKEFIFHNLKWVSQSLLLLFPLLLLVAILVPNFIKTTRIPLLVLLFFIGITFVQGATYFDRPYIREGVSLTWAPRFILPYSYLLAVVLLYTYKYKLSLETIWVKKKIAIGLILIYFINFPLISSIRQDVSYSKIIKSIIRNSPQVDIPELLKADDIKQLRQLELQLPERSNVYAFDYVIPIFLNHFIVWPYGREYEKADLAILPQDARFEELYSRLPLVMKENYEEIGKLGSYTLYASPDYKKIIHLK
jgi:hypothetical protein